MWEQLINKNRIKKVPNNLEMNLFKRKNMLLGADMIGTWENK